MGYPDGRQPSRWRASGHTINRRRPRRRRGCRVRRGTAAATPAQYRRPARPAVRLCRQRRRPARRSPSASTAPRRHIPAPSSPTTPPRRLTLARELFAVAQGAGWHFCRLRRSPAAAGAQHGMLTVMWRRDVEPSAAHKPVAMVYARVHACRLYRAPGSWRRWSTRPASPGWQALAEVIARLWPTGAGHESGADVIGGGAAQSWQLEYRGPTITEGRLPWFCGGLDARDLGSVFDEARRNGARLPVTALADQFYADVQRMGGGCWDTFQPDPPPARLKSGRRRVKAPVRAGVTPACEPGAAPGDPRIRGRGAAQRARCRGRRPKQAPAGSPFAGRIGRHRWPPAPLG